jgi:hypothetical protein
MLIPKLILKNMHFNGRCSSCVQLWEDGFSDTEPYTWVNGEFRWAKYEKLEEAIINTDSLVAEVIFVK